MRPRAPGGLLGAATATPISPAPSKARARRDFAKPVTASSRLAEPEHPSLQLSNYLFFTTDCEQALAYYTACGLGQVTELKRHGADGMPVATEAMRGRILHARFEGPGVLFFASDN